MAIVRSVAIGKAKKSVGNVTFRTVRGRTIASEKVGQRPTTRLGSAAQNQRTAYMALISRFERAHSESMKLSFTPTRYGSARNAFMSKNYQSLVIALAGLASDKQEAQLVTDAQIEQAITTYATANPTSIRRIDLAGQPVVYLDGGWNTIPDPEPIGPVTPFSLTGIAVEGTNYLSDTESVAPSTWNVGSLWSNKQVQLSGTGLIGSDVSIMTTADGSVVGKAGLSQVSITDTRVTIAIGTVASLWGFVINPRDGSGVRYYYLKNYLDPDA